MPCREAMASSAAQAMIAPAVAVKVLIIASAAPPLASRFEPALKPNQPTHSIDAPTMVKVMLCGAMMSLPKPIALADHDRADQAGDAGIDVNDRAAGEVERAEPEEVAVGVPDHVGDREVDEGDPEHDEERSRPRT